MSLSLPAVLDTAAAGPLLTAVRERVDAGSPLTFDGGAVERVGQACLQVLLAARIAAGARGLAYRIDRPSAPLVEMTTLAALPVLEHV